MIRRQVLTFRLGNESYAVDVHKVKELRGLDRITEIPNTPPFIRGVIDLRGVVVPIIDLRMKFDLPSVEYNAFTVVIVLNVVGQLAGIVVDAVTDVVTLSDRQVLKGPNIDARADSEFIEGMAKIGDRMCIVVDMERLMSGRDMQFVRIKSQRRSVGAVS